MAVEIEDANPLSRRGATSSACRMWMGCFHCASSSFSSLRCMMQHFSAFHFSKWIVETASQSSSDRRSSSDRQGIGQRMTQQNQGADVYV
jgi:hypothetical protein